MGDVKMTYIYMVTEVVFGFLGGALLMRVWDVTHTLKEMARQHSEDLLKSNLTNFDLGWDDCYRFVMEYKGGTTRGLKNALSIKRTARKPGEPVVTRK